jgi:hypothetical protein
MGFPKLKYPIQTKGLSNENRLIVLAYDAIYRAREKYSMEDQSHDVDYIHDLCANLSNLGSYIERHLCAMDMATRFEGFDGISPENQPTLPPEDEWEMQKPETTPEINQD